MLGMNQEEPSECSSGCESGWTMYLQYSMGEEEEEEAAATMEKRHHVWNEDGGDDYDDMNGHDEDLSMVSDASSGPPLFQSDNLMPYDEDDHDDEDDGIHGGLCCISALKKRRLEPKQQCHASSSFDDTASSPFNKGFFHLASNKESIEDVLDFSQGFSATHDFKKKVTMQKRFGTLKNPSPKNPVFGGEEVKKDRW